jgi:WD40 repeat protein
MKKSILILLVLFSYSSAFNQIKNISFKLADSTDYGWIDYGTYKLQKKIVGEYTYVKYSKDGKYLYTFSMDSLFRIWDVEKGIVTKEILIANDSTNSVDMDGDDKLIAIVQPELKSVNIYNLENDTMISSIQPFDSIDNEVWYEANYDNVKVIFNPLNNDVITSIEVISGIGYFDDAAVSHAWNKFTGKYEFDLPGYIPYCMKISPDGKCYVVCSWYYHDTKGMRDYYYYSHLMHFDNLDEIVLYNSNVQPYYEKYFNLAFSPDSKTLVGETSDKFYLLDTQNGNRIRSFRNIKNDDFNKTKTNTEYSRDGKYIINSTVDLLSINHSKDWYTIIRFYNVETGNELDSIVIDSLHSICFHTSPDSTSLACGLSDGRLFIYDLSKILGVDDKPVSNEIKLNISPNPTSSLVKISYSVPSYSFVRLSVFDIFGNEVGTIVQEYRQAGNYEENYDAGSLAEGIYFVRLVTGTEQRTGKFVKLK